MKMVKRNLPRFELPNKKWNIFEDSLLYRIVKDKEDKIYKKIFSFDLDNTLILSRGFFKPAQNEKDYIFYSDIIEFLKKKYEENYKIMIFSNQKGVSSGKLSLSNLINRVDDIIEKIGLPLECYLALKNDKYRKPRIGMYLFATKNYKEHLDEVIYVGDNANRIYDEKFKKEFINHLKYVYSKNNVNINIDDIYKRLKKDYTDTDLKFALNINAKFYTPEDLFLNIKNHISTDFLFNPKYFNKELNDQENINKKNNNHFYEICMKDYQSQNENTNNKNNTNNNIISKIQYTTNEKYIPPNDKQKLVILIGPPGCGKTFLCINYFSTYIRINMEEYKTMSKCIQVLKEKLLQRKNVIIDNVNSLIKNRLLYINEAKKINQNIEIRLIYFNYSKELIIHLNTFKLITDKTNKFNDVPTIAIHSFYKYVQEPSKDENVDHIIVLKDENFVPTKFECEEQKKLFFMYLN